MSSLISEDKISQLTATVQSGKITGNRLLNEELAKLIRQGKVRFEEAVKKTHDPKDLAKRLGRSLPRE